MREAAENSGMGRRRNADEIQDVVDQYRASGLSQIEYCRQTGTVVSTLRRYLRRSRSAEPQLVRVKLEPSTEAGGSFVLTVGNGRRIATDWRFNDAQLARLIRVVENA